MNALKTLTISILFLSMSISGFSQTRKITFSSQNLPIKEALAQIQQKSGYRILYNDEVVADDLQVSVNAKNLSVNEILEIILADTDLVPVLHSEELIVITRNDLINRTVELSGKISDESGLPIEFANVILYKSTDTIRIEQGSVTDKQGLYKLVNLLPGSYMMKISYVGYETITAEITFDKQSQQMLTRNFQLKTNTQNLETVVVSGERRVLTAEGGKLVFYMPTLLRNKSATNAYEALKEIPGVMEQDERLMLIGTSGTTILIDNKKTNMTTEQVMNLLRSIPVSRLENVEIIYSTPPQYNIRGAAINVNLKQSIEEEMQNTWQGEVAGEYRHRYYPGGEGRANVVYLGKKTLIDALYSYGNFRSLNKEILTSNHTLNGKVYDIKQQSGGINYYQIHNTRLALQHTFANKDKADISYTGMFDKPRNDRSAYTNIEGTITNTATDKIHPSSTHNIKADYSAHFGLNVGADYTLYNSNSDYFVINEQPASSAPAEKLAYQSEQNIHRMMFYANRSHSLKNSWDISYGFNYSGAKTNNRSDATKDGTDFSDATFHTQQREDIWNIFAGVSKSFSPKLSAQASLAAEYYKANETREGKTNELWNDVAWFPTLNVSYNASPSNIFQFSMSSDKTYPPYWRLNSGIYYVSSYTVMYGNPYLRPSRDYSIGVTYINKGKYVIRGYFNYTPNYFTELPYQSREKLEHKAISQNYNFRQNIGLMGVVPFKIGNRFSSRVVANVMYVRDKDDEFFDISFDRKTVMAIFSMNHDITLSAKPDVRMNVSGYAAPFGSIQGIYDLGPSGNLSSALTWTFDKERAKVILKADDIFDTRTPFASINFKGQKSTFQAYRYTRTFSLSFIYRFGGYKEKERKEVDTSRFGTH